MLIVQVGGSDELLDIFSNGQWVHSGVDSGNACGRLFTLDAESRVEVVEAHFECLLHSDVSDSHWTVLAFFLSLQIT